MVLGYELTCTYRLFKSNFGREDYLLAIKSQAHRKSLTQLRVGAHKLQIELGRHSVPYIDPAERICKNCDLGDVEDEFHFMIKCPLYNRLRQVLYEKITCKFPIFEMYDHRNKFIWLLGNLDTGVLNLVAAFVYDCFKWRTANIND